MNTCHLEVAILLATLSDLIIRSSCFWVSLTFRECHLVSLWSVGVSTATALGEISWARLQRCLHSSNVREDAVHLPADLDYTLVRSMNSCRVSRTQLRFVLQIGEIGETIYQFEG